MGGRERFIPRRVDELTDELAAPDTDGGTDAEGFRALSRLMSAHLHVEFHDRSQTLIDTWEDAEAGDEAGAVRLSKAEWYILLATAGRHLP